jgi:DNA-binding response OmpR family regulator
MKILVVDDDRDLREITAFALRRDGYLVIAAADLAAARAAIDTELPDLIILDVNLPDGSGFDLLPRLRGEGAPPVMLLTVRTSEEDQVHGLDLGADDYLTKPFSPRTLLARVRALLRRAAAERPSLPAYGPFTVNPDTLEATIADGRVVRLTALEFRLLQYLIANGGHTLSFDQLTRHVWGFHGLNDRQALKQLVRRLRLKIEPDPAEPRYLMTIAALGYALRV